MLFWYQWFHIIHSLHAGEGTENLFTQEYHIPRGQCPRWIWYSWVNTFSYFLYPHAITILLYQMKPRTHICVNTACKHILIPLERRLGYLKTTCKWCVPIASDVFPSKNDNSDGKTREASEGMEYDFYFTEYDFCPVWSYVLIFTHCPIKLIYLW